MLSQQATIANSPLVWFFVVELSVFNLALARTG
jgi:hypothetical protein